MNEQETETVTGNVSVAEIVMNFLLIMVIIGLLSASWLFVNWLNQPGNFPFKKVELVKQLENQSTKELQSVIINTLEGGFFSLNVDNLRSQLVTQLAWVKSISVRKVWPDKLSVNIVEHKPIARWLSLDGSVPKAVQKRVQKLVKNQLLSNEAVIFNPSLDSKQKRQFSQMVLLTGSVNNSKKILTQCVQINEKLQKLNLGMRQCGMNKRRSWQLQIFLKPISNKSVKTSNIDVKLGKEDIMQHLDRFTNVFSGKLKHYLNLIDVADLRYSNGFSIKWKPVKHLVNTSHNVL